MQYVFTSSDIYYFKTDLCREFDEKYGHLFASICEHEKRICNRLIKYIRENLADIQQVCKLCAKLDCMIAFAELATQRNYVRPNISPTKKIHIKGGRHPLLEIDNHFTPNDTTMSYEDKDLVTILNSPNASGKSVYLRQVALIAFMTHIGCYVPATSATLSILNGIHSKIYSSEAVFLGTSAFLSDLQQTARLLKTSGKNSLIVLDEFGKGTELDAGRALLQSCIEGIVECNDMAPFTIISTHYHDIYDHLENKEFVTQKTFEVIRDEKTDTIASTYKLISGKCQEIYAIHLPEIREFIGTLFFDKNSSNDTIRTEPDNNQKCRILCAYEILKKYIENKHIKMDEVTEILHQTRADQTLDEDDQQISNIEFDDMNIENN